MAGTVHEVENHALLAEVEREAANAAQELVEAARLHRGQIVVIGCSTSEVVGHQVGSWSTPEAAQAIFRGLQSVFAPRGVYLAAQCCEHLNRALIVEHEAVPNAEIVNVLPQPKAGSSFATAAYESFRHPVALEEIRADVIFCVDYDENIDHRAVTMLFDEALGEILTAAPDYDPLVLKGFTYSTAFRAPADFYDSVNLLSTVNPDGERMENGVYRWDARVRLPMDGRALSRSITECRSFAVSREYESQMLWRIAPRIINGDKVFWQRCTGSLLYGAAVCVSSGSGAETKRRGAERSSSRRAASGHAGDSPCSTRSHSSTSQRGKSRHVRHRLCSPSVRCSSHRPSTHRNGQRPSVCAKYVSPSLSTRSTRRSFAASGCCRRR